MRTTFGEMHLFSDASQKHDTTFIMNRKECGRWLDRQTERKGERQCGWKRVAAWILNSSIYEGLETKSLSR